MVCPLVQQLRNFYEFALKLQEAVCDILVVLCLPTMGALEHLEKQQVGISDSRWYMCTFCVVHNQCSFHKVTIVIFTQITL